MKLFRWSWLLAFGVAGVVLAQQTVSVLINNKTAQLETVQRNGKVFVEAVAFAKALGATAKLEGGKLSVTTANAPLYTQGTTQQAGGIGVLGQSYTLGRTKPLNFLLRSAEFQVSRVVIGSEIYAPSLDQKLLLLRGTVQNPQKVEAYLSNYHFKLTAVDTNGENHVFANFLGREGSTTALNLYLKPTQKIDVFIPILVPAKGTIPKLIIENKDENGSPVLRYDLSKSIRGLSAPYAATDPFTALSVVTATSGVYYSTKKFDFKLASVDYSTEAMTNESLEPSERLLLATFVARNPIDNSDSRYLLDLKNDLEFSALDADDNINKALYDWYKVSRPEPLREFPQMVFNQEAKFRIAFKIPRDLLVKKLKVRGGLRDFVFDVSGTK